MPNQGDNIPEQMQAALDDRESLHERTPPLESRLSAIERRLDALDALVPLVQALTSQRKRRKQNASLDR